MTKKQMRKLAQEIYECELVHQSEASSKEEKVRADNRIMQITNQIMALHDGFSVMLELDSIIQSLAEKDNNNTL